MNFNQKRRAENEVVFRQRNEAIKKLAKDVLITVYKADLPLQFICECSSEDCHEAIEMSAKEYEEARKNNRQFVIKPGHEHLDIEQVVHHDDYTVVEKFEQPPPTDGKLNAWQG